MKDNRAVSNWLLLLCAMVFGMVAGGGHARTICAGFVIQSWHPLTGFIPPLNAADWARQFALFQATADYQAHPIPLTTYKTLFWPMFLDRCWGRLLALVFLVPLALFWRAGRVSTRLALWLLAIFALGAAQAVFGWLLVLAGRRQGVITPPAALAAPHFCAAMLILAALLWTALTLRHPEPAPCAQAPALRPWANTSIGLIFLTMGFGALTATSNALAYDHSFPTMDGQWVPRNLFSLHPVAANFIANPATIQFFHRALATATALVTLATAALGLRAEISPGLRDFLLLLAGLVALQYLLGMATIVLGSANLGFIHELNAVLLFMAAIAVRHGLRGGGIERRLARQASASFCEQKEAKKL